MNDYVEVDLSEVSRVVRSQEFMEFLLLSTNDFNVAAFILQTLLDKLESSQQQLDFL